MGLDRMQTWFAVTISVALIGVGSFAYDGSSALAGRAPGTGVASRDVRAQADDQPEMEQVGEGEAADPETLDEGAPPAQEAEDVELLDQGAPPTTATAPPSDTAAAPPAPAAPPADAVAAPPADGGAVYTAPAAPTATGPVLPPGFGSGRVRASAGRFGFPVGLEDCHVGAVTGRAYVGIDCGEEDGDVVGHAPSFEDFPFVLEAEFPFESDDAFFSDPFFTGRNSADLDDGSDVEVSTRRSTRNNGNRNNRSNADNNASRNESNSTTAENVVVTGIGTGNAAVELAQRERDRGPRVRAGKDRSGQTTKRQKARNDGASAAAADNESNSGGQATKQSQNKKQKADKGNKGKKSKDAKKKKREKRRAARND